MKGIAIAFHSRHEETITHLFINSECAVAIWYCLGSIFQLPKAYKSILHILRVWMSVDPHVSKFVEAKISIATYALWEIWKARCRATYDNTLMNARGIGLRNILETQRVAILTKGTKRHNYIQRNILELLGIPASRYNVCRGSWLRWENPSLG